MRFFSKRNFRPFVFRRSPLFAAFARNWGGEKKGGGEKHSPDLQEPIFNFLVAAKGEARGCARLIRVRIRLLSGGIFQMPARFLDSATLRSEW